MEPKITAKITAESPAEIAQLFWNHADHEKAREVSLAISGILGTLQNSHATNACGLASALVSFILAMPNRGVDSEALDAVLAIAHSILTLNARKDLCSVN